MSWGDRQVEYLRARWGIDTPRAIGLAVGMTRNAVIGKAHRLGLPDLGNPVGGGSREKHAPKPRAPYARRDESGAPKVTGVKAMRLAAAEAVAASSPAPQPKEPPVVIPSRFAKVKPIAHDGTALPMPVLGSGQCVWPVESGPQGHRFCGQPVEPGKPYCADHRARAKGAQSAKSTAIGRENARRQSQLNRAERESGAGFFHHGRGWKEL